MIALLIFGMIGAYASVETKSGTFENFRWECKGNTFTFYCDGVLSVGDIILDGDRVWERAHSIIVAEGCTEIRSFSVYDNLH